LKKHPKGEKSDCGGSMDIIERIGRSRNTAHCRVVTQCTQLHQLLLNVRRSNMNYYYYTQRNGRRMCASASAH